MGGASLLPETMSTDPGPVDGDKTTDEIWFRHLFEATYRDLVAYARRRVPDDTEAHDIVSEVFTTAWRRRAELATSSTPLPWLYGVASNMVRNQRRASKRRLRLAERLEAQPEPTASNDPAERPGAEIRSALGRLSFDDQEVLRLVAWEGLSHAEAGQVLSCSPNAAAIRLHRARRRLEQAVSDEAGQQGGAAP